MMLSKDIKRLAKIVLFDNYNLTESVYFKELLKNSSSFNGWYDVLGTAFIITNVASDISNTETVLQIWKINLDEKFKHLIEIYSQGARGILISFDPYEENFGHRLYQQIEEYISMFHYPIVIGLISTRKKDTFSHDEKELINEILSDVESLIRKDWNSEFVILPFLNSQTSLQVFLKEYAEKLKLVAEKIALMDKLKLNFQVIAIMIQKIVELFPEYEGRIFLTPKEIIIKGELSNYVLTFDGRSYITSRSGKKYLCLVKKSRLKRHYKEILRNFISTTQLQNELTHLPREFYNLALLIAAKIIYLLNDKFFKEIDPVFSEQLKR